jgi:hypothetical protein
VCYNLKTLLTKGGHMAKRKVTKKTSSGLVDMLFSEIDNLRNDVIEPAKLNAISKASNQLISVAKLELEVDKFEHKKRLDAVNLGITNKNGSKALKM